VYRKKTFSKENNLKSNRK